MAIPCQRRNTAVLPNGGSGGRVAALRCMALAIGRNGVHAVGTAAHRVAIGPIRLQQKD